MPVFLNRNINGSWRKIEVTEDETKLLEKQLFLEAVEKVAKCRENLPKKIQNLNPGLLDQLTVLLVEKMVSPLHYMIENYVDEKLSKGDKATDL